MLTSRTTRQRLLSLCPATFLQLHFFFMFMILQILTSVKEITLVTWMLHAWTPLDHMYVNVMLDILEMEKTAQVNLISSLQYSRIVLHDTFDYSAAPSSCVARQLDNLSLRNSVIFSSRVHLLECSSRYLMRIKTVVISWYRVEQEKKSYMTGSNHVLF